MVRIICYADTPDWPSGGWVDPNPDPAALAGVNPMQIMRCGPTSTFAAVGAASRRVQAGGSVGSAASQPARAEPLKAARRRGPEAGMLTPPLGRSTCALHGGEGSAAYDRAVMTTIRRIPGWSNATTPTQCSHASAAAAHEISVNPV